MKVYQSMGKGLFEVQNDGKVVYGTVVSKTRGVCSVQGGSHNGPIVVSHVFFMRLHIKHSWSFSCSVGAVVLPFFLNQALQLCLNSRYQLELDFGPILIHIHTLGKAPHLPFKPILQIDE